MEIRLAFAALALAFVWSLEGVAAQTVGIPVAIVPGTAEIQFGQVPGATPIALPHSETFTSADPDCAFGQGTVSVGVVGGYVEVEIDGSAVASVGAGACDVFVIVQTEVEFLVPELGGTVTMARVEATPLVQNLSQPSFAQIAFHSSGGGTTSSYPGVFSANFSQTLEWTLSGLEYVTGLGNLFMPSLIPGDTVQIPVQVVMHLRGEDGQPTIGTVRVRFRYVTTLPEPSAALMLPIGGLACIGLAKLRGPRQL